MKLRNKSGLIAAVAGLAAVSMFSVGFATWVISGSDEVTIDGTITVEEVNDNNLYVISGAPANLQAIVFGKPAAPLASHTYNWLKVDTVAQENLSGSFTVNVSNMTTSNYSTVLTATLTPMKNGADATSAYNAAVTAGIIAALPTPTISCTSNGVATVSYAFAWGLPAGANPYDYYNELDAKAETSEGSGVTNAQDAKNKLQALYENLTGVTYKITLTTHIPA